MFNIPEQEHILNTHIDHLAEWYADAERITGTNLTRIGEIGRASCRERV